MRDLESTRQPPLVRSVNADHVNKRIELLVERTPESMDSPDFSEAVIFFEEVLEPARATSWIGSNCAS